ARRSRRRWCAAPSKASPTSGPARRAAKESSPSWASASRTGCCPAEAMETLHGLLDAPQLLALAAALGWLSGIRIYAAVFLAGAAGYLGWVDLPPGLQVLQHPGVLAASGFMFGVEFFADKLPWIDSMWDAVHTFIRIPAGAALAFGALGA